jgi:hypothetical protein
MPLINIDYASRLWQAVEWCYRMPKAPPRHRNPEKPLQVIAVGFSRSGTESLQNALIRLGYGPCYHGWDLLFSEPFYNQEWVALAQKKWHSKTGDCHISAEEFDRIIGHAVSIVDVPASAFAIEMIEAYPEAKVIINQRRDMDKWWASSNKHIVGVNETFLIWFLSWFDAEMFWMWNVFERYLHFRPPRARNWNLSSGLRDQGKWVFREHMYAVRGLLWTRGETDRMLDWYVEDGWDPLCKFLDKPVPDEPFPRTNDAAGFEGRKDAVVKNQGARALRNIGFILATAGIGVGAVLYRTRVS